jgi:hypothetical protein
MPYEKHTTLKTMTALHSSSKPLQNSEHVKDPRIPECDTNLAKQYEYPTPPSPAPMHKLAAMAQQVHHNRGQSAAKKFSL